MNTFDSMQLTHIQQRAHLDACAYSSEIFEP
jgi:hypothetical protein